MNIRILFLAGLLMAELSAFAQNKDTLCDGRDGHTWCWVAEKYSDTIFCNISQCYRLSATLEISYDTCQPDSEGWRYSHITKVRIDKLFAQNPYSQVFVSFAPTKMNSSNTYGLDSYATDPQIIKDTAEVALIIPVIEDKLNECFLGNPCKDNTCSFISTRKQKKVPCRFYLIENFVVMPK